LRAAYEARTGLPRATYMRNAADAARVRSPRFRRRIARGVADGVRRYLRAQPSPNR
jgi:hypothetical protein